MGKITDLKDRLAENSREFREGYEERGSLIALGHMLRSVRKDRGWTQTQVAEAAGIDQADVSRLENGEGERGPTLDTLVKYAHALQVRLDIGLSKDRDKLAEVML